MAPVAARLISRAPITEAATAALVNILTVARVPHLRLLQPTVLYLSR